ncbi:MAG: hypothetical protein PHV59_00865 [Victivallales bacterium]|nr:hypothetical protein [Victivallales bacterium]
MKKFFAAAVPGLLLVLVGCNCICSSRCENADSIVAKIQKAVNVSGQELPTSSVMVYDSGIGDKNKSRVTVKLKSPNKIRLEINQGNALIVSAFNGHKGWEYITGKKLRELKGRELRELKFQAAYLAPNLKFKKLFEKIELAGSAEAAGIKCWKLICTPKARYKAQPVELFVDKNNYLVVKSFEKLYQSGETVEINTYFGDYKDEDGIMVPQLMISEIAGRQLLESKLVSVSWNPNIADSEFDMPKALTSAE